MKRLLALDLSLRATGYAVGLVGDRPPATRLEGNPFDAIEASGVYFPQGETLGQKCNGLHDWLVAKVIAERPAAIAIEQVFFHNSRNAAVAMMGCNTVAAMVAERHRLPIREVGTSTLKKFAVDLQGERAKKEMERIARLYRDIKDNNESDAMWVAVYFAAMWAGKWT